MLRLFHHGHGPWSQWPHVQNAVHFPLTEETLTRGPAQGRLVDWMDCLVDHKSLGPMSKPHFNSQPHLSHLEGKILHRTVLLLLFWLSFCHYVTDLTWLIISFLCLPTLDLHAMHMQMWHAAASSLIVSLRMCFGTSAPPGLIRGYYANFLVTFTTSTAWPFLGRQYPHIN